MNTIVCKTLTEFDTLADQWSELWENSDCQNPNVKSGSLANACLHLYQGQIRFIIVFDKTQAIAAIPLTLQKRRPWSSVAGLPNNQWGQWGEMLIHREYDNAATYEKLAQSIAAATCHNLSFPLIDQSSPQWHQLLHALKQQGCAVIDSYAYDVGIVKHKSAWSDFQSKLSKGFRKKLRKYAKSLSQMGQIKFEFHRNLDEHSVKPIFEAAFEVEQQSWKAQHQSTLADSGMDEFFLEQAIQLAKSKSLRISLLKLDDRVIAFEFGMVGGETYYSWKIGYDAEYSAYGPGHLLAELMTQDFHEQGDCQIQDTVGPVSEATSKWASQFNQRHNLLISGTSLQSKFVFRLIQIAKFAKRRWSSVAQRWENFGSRKSNVGPVPTGQISKAV